MAKLIPQNFTTYSLTWMPEKIETQSATEYAWSSVEWTDILSLSFDCEASMLCLIFGYVFGSIVNTGTYGTCYSYFRLLLDGTELPATVGSIGHKLENNDFMRGCYGIHTVAIVPKGTHTLKIQMASNTTSTTAYAYERRLTILKGFYQGGTT